MRLTDFGLWFYYWNGDTYKWASTIPQEGYFYVYYNGTEVAWYDYRVNTPDILRFQNQLHDFQDFCNKGVVVSFRDFEIIRNITGI